MRPSRLTTAPRGGSPLSGLPASHERIPSAKLVDNLKGQSAWVGELCSKGEEDEGRVQRFMHEGADFRGVPLRVAEMTGDPGDVILWRPNLIHTAARANNRNTPRLVLSATVDADREAAEERLTD